MVLAVFLAIGPWITFRPELWEFLGQQAYEHQCYPIAEQAFRAALRICSRDTSDDTIRARIALSFAILLKERGRYTEAEPLYEEALYIRKTVLGQDHSDTVVTMKALADLYQTQGRYADSEILCKEILRIRKKTLGDRHRTTAVALNNLGVLYSRQVRYKEAEPILQEALQIGKQALGTGHPDTAKHNLLAAPFS